MTDVKPQPVHHDHVGTYYVEMEATLRKVRGELQDLRDRYEENLVLDIAAATNEKDTEIAELRVTLRRQAQEITGLLTERDNLIADRDAESARLRTRIAQDCEIRMQAYADFERARDTAIAERDAARAALREACRRIDGSLGSPCGLDGEASISDLRKRGGIDG